MSPNSMPAETNFTTPRRDPFATAIAVFCCVLLLAPCLGGQKAAPSKPIDLNTATIEQLQQLPGVGPATAKAIVQFREKSGPFRRPEDLLAIHGISRSRFEKIKPYVTVSPSAKHSESSR